MIRHFFLITVTLCLTLSSLAQVPDAFQYQAVIRDSDGNIKSNENLTVSISILKGAPDGISVYTEDHYVTTTGQGVVNLMIGKGNTSDNLATIDWSSSTYFMEVSVDGSVMGTSQLLSVPYAMFAHRADSVSDHVLKNYVTYMDVSDTASAIRSEIPSLEHYATYADVGDTASQIREEIPQVQTYSVGDFAHGGIVFWVDESGQHGLVCAKEDQNSGAVWYNGTFTDTEAHGDGVYAGEMNTMLIISNQGSDSYTYAAGMCANYEVMENNTTYGDWYLPSLEELKLMYQQKDVIDSVAVANGGSALSESFYWSSTEVEADNEQAWSYNFLAGSSSDTYKYTSSYVRAIRSF